MKIPNKTNSLFVIVAVIYAVYDFMIKTFERYENRHGNKNN